MNKKAFTLVELLTVIIIIGLITVISVPLIQRASARIKENMLESKKSSAEHVLIMWSQENEKCFMDVTGKDCIIDITKDCTEDGDNLTCETTYGNLANNSLIAYDKDNKVINPVDESDMSNDKLSITYNRYKRIFSITPGSNTHTTKTPITYTNPTREITSKQLFNEEVKPLIRLLQEENNNWQKKHSNTVIIQDIDSGLASGGSFKYGWSTSNVKEPETYFNYNLSYASGTTEEIRADISAEGLTGKMYVWIKPNISDRMGNKADNLVSLGTFFFDNTPPEPITMNYSLSNWNPYNGDWTNQDLLVARSENNKIPSGGKDNHSGLKEYQISVDNHTWTKYNYSSASNLYKLSENGIYKRFFRACDNLDNCNQSIEVTGYIDKSKPTISDVNVTNSQIVFKMSDNADGSGIASYCLINSSSSSSCTWQNYTGSGTHQTPNIKINNTYNTQTSYLFAKDKADNVSDGYEIKPLGVTVIFHRNTSTSDALTATRVYMPGKSGQKFETFNWSKSGRTLFGWNEAANKDKNQKDYSPTSGVKDNWINNRLGQTVHLYAKWVSISAKKIRCYTLGAGSCNDLVPGCSCKCNTVCWCSDEPNGGWQGEIKLNHDGLHWWAYKDTTADVGCPADSGNTNFPDWSESKGCPSGYSSLNSTSCIKYD